MSQIKAGKNILGRENTLHKLGDYSLVMRQWLQSPTDRQFSGFLIPLTKRSLTSCLIKRFTNLVNWHICFKVSAKGKSSADAILCKV